MKRALLSGASLGLALIVFLSLAGCNKNSNSSSKSSSTTSNSSSSSSSGSSSSSKSSGSGSFVGTWKPASSSDSSIGSLTIKDDGTFLIKSVQSDGPSISGSYTASGDTITLKDPEGKGDDATGTIADDGRLKIADKSGQTEYFVRD